MKTISNAHFRALENCASSLAMLLDCPPSIARLRTAHGDLKRLDEIERHNRKEFEKVNADERRRARRLNILALVHGLPSLPTDADRALVRELRGEEAARAKRKRDRKKAKT